MQQIAVNIIVNDLYWESRYCIENLLLKTSLKPKLYITDNGSRDIRITEFCERVCEEYKGFFTRLEEPIPLANAYNLFLKKTTEPYICLFPINILVNQSWLENLYAAYESCTESGVMSIRSGEENSLLTPILHESESDNLNDVWLSNKNTVENILFFHQALITKTGLFDEDLNASGFEQEEFCIRASSNGYKNYYITKNTCVKVSVENELLFPEKTHEALINFKKNVEGMLKNNNFKK
jgi:hypothetical protein